MLSKKEIICPDNLLKIAKKKGPVKAVIVNAVKKVAVESAKENGVTVHQFLVNASAHRFFFVIEAPDYDSIEETFGRCKTLGELEITPVRKW